MAYNTRMFEHVYGSTMLDSLHNYFPELMYDDAIFPNQTIRWMRYRMSTLFPQQYAQKMNEYRIYQSANRRIEFSNWAAVNNPDRAHLRMPSPPAATAATAAAPPVIPTAAETFMTPVRTTIRTGVINIPTPLGPSTGAPVDEEPYNDASPDIQQTPQQQSRRRTMPSIERRTNRVQRRVDDMDGLVNNLFGTMNMLDMMGGEYEPMWGGTGFGNVTTTANVAATANLLNLLATATILPTNTAFQDVVVAPTQEQIDAGSTIVNYAELPRDTSCAICQEDTGDSAWRRLHCNHYFHRGCVDHWFEQNVHCPVCRADIRESTRTE